MSSKSQFSVNRNTLLLSILPTSGSATFVYTGVKYNAKYTIAKDKQCKESLRA